MKIDEFVEKREEQSSKEPKNYKNFVYYEPHTLPNSIGNQQTSPPESPESPVKPELQPYNLSHGLKDLSHSQKDPSFSQCKPIHLMDLSHK